MLRSPRKSLVRRATVLHFTSTITAEIMIPQVAAPQHTGRSGSHLKRLLVVVLVVLVYALVVVGIADRALRFLVVIVVIDAGIRSPVRIVLDQRLRRPPRGRRQRRDCGRENGKGVHDRTSLVATRQRRPGRRARYGSTLAQPGPRLNVEVRPSVDGRQPNTIAAAPMRRPVPDAT
jgi:hypothetical protein